MFYRAFRSAQGLILEKVLYNEFRPAVLNDALASFFSANFPHRVEEIEAFLRHYDDGMKPLPERWSLSNAVAVSHFRHSMHYFTSDFASKLSIHPHIE